MKKIVVNIVKWIFSVFMLLFALTSFDNKGGMGSGIVFLALAIFVNPIFTNLLKKRNITIKKRITIPIIIGALCVGFIMVPTSEKNTLDTDVNQESVLEQVENTKGSTNMESVVISKSMPVEQEKIILETAKQENLEEDSAEQERLAQEEAEQESLAQEKAEQERLEQERLAKEKAEQEKIAQEKAEKERLEQEKSDKEKTEENSSNGGNVYNFDKYNNPDQQNTEDKWVLNTKSKKIHYPSCNDVSKIKPENYSTSNLSLDELKQQDYTTCGHCFK